MVHANELAALKSTPLDVRNRGGLQVRFCEI